MKGESSSTPKRRSFKALALWSGFLGATASCAAKFAFGSNTSSGTVTAARFQVSILARIYALIIMVLCNAGMLGSFLEGMEESGSVAASSLASASNFVASAAYGRWVWNELGSTSSDSDDLDLLYYTGLVMIVTGVLLMSVQTKSKVE
jgi:hypothetical protein